MAGTAGSEPTALRAVAELAVLPLLHACGRRWAARAPVAWQPGYCPICGAWPTLAESRGVERTRRLRCARCGDWATDWLRCPYCDAREHTRLGSLVAHGSAERRRVEVCRACQGYLKTLTVLQGSPPADVMLDDLASVDLDVAARGAGFTRPPGPGYRLGARVVEAPGLARRLAWRA